MPPSSSNPQHNTNSNNFFDDDDNDDNHPRHDQPTTTTTTTTKRRTTKPATTKAPQSHDDIANNEQLPLNATRQDLAKFVTKKRSQASTVLNPTTTTTPTVNSKQLTFMTIAAICGALNHHTYLFITVVILALFSTHISPLLTLGSIFHVLVTGSVCTIALAMWENPTMTRPERLKRQLGHTLMLSHFGGVGTIGEVVRLWYGVEGCTVENVKRSLWYQFGLLAPKIITMTAMYSQLASKLTEMAGRNGVSVAQLDLMFYIGWALFISLCLSFFLPVIAYVFMLGVEDVEEDDGLSGI